MVDMFGRLDARYSPINCPRLKELLVARGYVVQDGQLGPGSATPSAEKLRELIGTPHLLESRVDFSKTTGPFRWLEPAQNDFGLVGSGTLLGDGLHLQLAGRRGFHVVLGALSPVFKRRVQLDWRGIVNVESAGDMVHFFCRAQDSPTRSITLVLPDHALAEVVAAALPKARTLDFRPGLREHAEFGRCLLIVNALTYLICALAGGHWLTLPTPVLIEFGANLGPFTADGDWWRLLTSMFLHLGLIHLAFNMWALASFGPLAERLYGSLVAMSLIAAGLWAVKHSSSQLAGEGAFWRALHWTAAHEKTVNETANELSNTRFAAVRLDPEPKYTLRLELLRTISSGRARGYAHLAAASPGTCA
jgi:hypothetical protein